MPTGDGPWRGIVPPYRTLDPALARAARSPLLEELVSALPDEHGAAGRLNAFLPMPMLRYSGQAWCLVLTEPLALGLLVVSGGWHRMKRCACGAVFVDRTAAATRRRCAAHLRGSRGAGGADAG